MDETLDLGGNIELSGFSQFDKPSLIVVKKLVGNFARKLTEQNQGFESLSLRLKSIHGNKGDKGRFEIHAKLLTAGKPMVSEVTEHNLYFALDKALKKLQR